MFSENPFNPGGDPSAVTFRDVILISLLIFVFLIIWLLPHINPPGEKEKDEAPPPGNVIVEMRWPDDKCVDIDLWVRPPKGGRIGFSRQNSENANLLRDDTGCKYDPIAMNYENFYTRGILEGQYTVNAHWYSDALDEQYDDITVRIVVSIKGEKGGSMRQILATEVTLEKVWQELTAFSFKLDEDGKLIEDSVTDEWTKVGLGNPEATTPAMPGGYE